MSDHEEDGVPRVKIGATGDFSGVFSGSIMLPALTLDRPERNVVRSESTSWPGSVVSAFRRTIEVRLKPDTTTEGSNCAEA